MMPPDRPVSARLEELFKRGRVYECMGCPIHGDEITPISHETICDNTCYDTHAYWLVPKWVVDRLNTEDGAGR